MENNDFMFIQNQIGYQFENPDLLRQAFVRRSYSKENGGEDNEVLEFIGDKVLDFIVVMALIEKYGYFFSECDDFDKNNDCNEFCSEYDENELTEIKKKLVEKKMLAHKIDTLGLGEYLIMGKGDIKNRVQEEDSVKEDLFEAILGAVALDSKWNLSELREVVAIMLDIDSELAEGDSLDYVKQIQDWTGKRYKSVPFYHFEKTGYETTFYYPFDGISQTFNVPGDSRVDKIQFDCYLKIGNDLPVFRGFGNSKSEARKAVCKVAYDYLEKNDLINTISTEIENPNKSEAINQLETLARRGYFSIPTYEFRQSYDRNGNPVWECEGHILEMEECFTAKSSSKKEAKKLCAFQMLKRVLNK